MKEIIRLILWILVSLSAGFIGSKFMPGEWYRALQKPVFNPPGWVFGPVWTALYIMMGTAAWLIWKTPGDYRMTFPTAVFLIQLALNALWSYLFFGLQRPDLAFFEVSLLWIMILITMISFWKIRPLAGVLLLPYLLWVSFASVLNWAIWRLNV